MGFVFNSASSGGGACTISCPNSSPPCSVYSKWDHLRPWVEQSLEHMDFGNSRSAFFSRIVYCCLSRYKEFIIIKIKKVHFWHHLNISSFFYHRPVMKWLVDKKKDYFLCLSPVLLHLQATRVLHVSRRWTRVPPVPVTIMGHATPRARAPWDSAVAAQQASLALRVPS